MVRSNAVIVRQFVLSWLEGGEGVKRYPMVPVQATPAPSPRGGVIEFIDAGLKMMISRAQIQ
jgi:hypothetical protein